MALPWALAFLSLLPLLNAQSSSCVNFTVPITNAVLDQVGAWTPERCGQVFLSLGFPSPCWLMHNVLT